MLLRYPEFKEKAVTLSYDDGVEYDTKLIEIMTKYGLKGTFNLNSEMMESAPYRHRRLSPAECRALYPTAGMEVAVHGAKHLDLLQLDDGAVIREVSTDRDKLEQLFGTMVRGMAYAYGTFNDHVADLVGSCGIVYSRSCFATEKFGLPTNWLQLPPTCHHAHPRLMELAEEFLQMDVNNAHAVWRKPQLFYLWGHSYEFHDNDNWHIIEDFCKLVGRNDSIWYATNLEIWEYINAFQQLIYSADGSLVQNPTCTDLYAIQGVQMHKVMIPAGATVKLPEVRH